MSKKLLVLILLQMLAISVLSQDPLDILKKSYDQCQSIQNGYYEMTHYKKFLSDKDTTMNVFHCHFQKLKDDTLFSTAFHCNNFSNGDHTGDVLYTGDDFVRTNEKDSIATIMSKALWAKEIKSFSRNQTFFSPFTSKKSSPLPRETDFTDQMHTFRLIGEEFLNNQTCYHIQVNEMPEYDNSDMIKPLRIEKHFWILTSGMIPVQYSIAYDVMMNNDTMYQYDKYVLNKFEIGNLRGENFLTLNSIPAYIKIKEYVPHSSPDPLPADTVAPEWQLSALTGEQINLSDLRGKLVLIDFFYQSCYPCLLALPEIQELHEKYNNKGLIIIGIDPIDDNDILTEFVKERGISYKVLPGGKNVAEDYRVSGYPTIYLIGKNGNILFSQAGYGQNTKKTLEELIRQKL